MDQSSFVKNALKLDDSFRFHCNQCGQCCRNRDDILLSPYDLNRVAHALFVPPKTVIDRYCNLYVGENSRLPVVVIRPLGKERVCPFLKNNRCTIHASKPTVCALFPLGRFAAVKEDKPGETQYFLQPVHCGTKSETHTVRSWLTSFDLLESDAWFHAWQNAILRLSPLMRRLGVKYSARILETLYSLMFVELYLHYEQNQDFLAQFKKNADNLTSLLVRLDQESFGKEDGK